MRFAKFEVGKTYSCNSPCDSFCVWFYKVIKRTTKQVTLQNTRGEQVRKKIYDGGGYEYCLPHGNYSMAAVLCAKDVINNC